MKAKVWASVLAFVALAISVHEAAAIIMVPTDMRLFFKDSTQIVQVKVDKFDAEKNMMVFDVEKDIKGKLEQRSFNVVWKVNPKAKNENFVPPLLKRFGNGQQAILFINDGGKFWRLDQRPSLVAYGCANGNWFMVESFKADDGKYVLKLSQGEPFLRGTFKGTTAELNRLLTDHIAGKAELPKAAKESGFGPEFPSAK